MTIKYLITLLDHLNDERAVCNGCTATCKPCIAEPDTSMDGN